MRPISVLLLLSLNAAFMLTDAFFLPFGCGGSQGSNYLFPPSNCDDYEEPPCENCGGWDTSDGNYPGGNGNSGILYPGQQTCTGDCGNYPGGNGNSGILYPGQQTCTGDCENGGQDEGGNEDPSTDPNAPPTGENGGQDEEGNEEPSTDPNAPPTDENNEEEVAAYADRLNKLIMENPDLTSGTIAELFNSETGGRFMVTAEEIDALRNNLTGENGGQDEGVNEEPSTDPNAPPTDENGGQDEEGNEEPSTDPNAPPTGENGGQDEEGNEEPSTDPNAVPTDGNGGQGEGGNEATPTDPNAPPTGENGGQEEGGNEATPTDPNAPPTGENGGQDEGGNEATPTDPNAPPTDENGGQDEGGNEATPTDPNAPPTDDLTEEEVAAYAQYLNSLIMDNPDLTSQSIAELFNSETGGVLMVTAEEITALRNGLTGEGNEEDPEPSDDLTVAPAED